MSFRASPEPDQSDSPSDPEHDSGRFWNRRHGFGKGNLSARIVVNVFHNMRGGGEMDPGDQVKLDPSVISVAPFHVRPVVVSVPLQMECPN